MWCPLTYSKAVVIRVMIDMTQRIDSAQLLPQLSGGVSKFVSAQVTAYQQSLLIGSIAPGSFLRLNSLIVAYLRDKETLEAITNEVFTRTAFGRSAAGIDGISPASELQSQVTSKRRIKRDLLLIYSANYSRPPLPVKVIIIPKTDGKERRLRVLSMYDSYLQTFCLLSITPFVEAYLDSVHNANPRILVTGSRIAFSTWDSMLAIKQRFSESARKCESGILMVDISSCFECISVKSAISLIFPEYITDGTPNPAKNLLDLLVSLYATPGVFDPSKAQEFFSKSPIAQGFCCSPALCNLWVTSIIDQFLSAFFLNKYSEVSVVTYLDDLTFIGPLHLLPALHDDLVSFFKERSMLIKPDKTILLSRDPAHKKTGQILGFKVNLFSTPIRKTQGIRFLVGRSPHKEPIWKRIPPLAYDVRHGKYEDKRANSRFVGTVRGHLNYYYPCYDIWKYRKYIRSIVFKALPSKSALKIRSAANFISKKIPEVYKQKTHFSYSFLSSNRVEE
jgi:hypothetical protein